MNACVNVPLHPATLAPPDAASRSLTIDACRGLAALLVYFSHTGTALVLPPFVLYGDSGVHLFFVLSGYLLYGPFARALLRSQPLPAVGSFYLRRWLRIWPPFAIALVVSAVARFLLHTKPPSVGLLVEHALFVTNYDFRPGIPAFYRINAVFWTLAVEFQFYLLLPLLALGARSFSASRPRWAAYLPVLLCLALGPCARSLEFAAWGGGMAPRFRTLPSFLDLFGWGMAASVLETELGRMLAAARRARAVLAGLGVALVIGVNDYRHAVGAGWLESSDARFTRLFPLLIGAGCAALVLALVCTDFGRIARALRRPVAAVGTVSYSLYLYHILVQQFLFRTLPLPNVQNFYLRGFVAGLIFLPLSLAVAGAAYWLVERPSLRWAHKLREQRTVRVPALSRPNSAMTSGPVPRRS